jgi:A/G-specific adenine glycosylase
VPDNIARPLLDWYDANARALPWRAPPGTPPADPYRVWLSEVMLQQTQVVTAAPYFDRFVARWPDFASLAAAADADLMAAWAGLGYYARARNLLACAREVAALGGLPDTEAGLRTLPGIGGYTAAAIAAIAFGRRAVVVDANVERVVARLFALAEPLPAAKPRLHALADSITPDARAGDFAQAMMDLGATICTARSPRCLLCPLRAQCDGLASGSPEAFPVKLVKRAKPQRYGTMFWLTRGDRVLLVRRPDRGLLGGMRALPSGDWTDSPPGLAGAPAGAEWDMLDATVRHVFTHFRLECALAAATIGEHSGAAEGEWWPVADLESAGLPTVFAKAARMFGRVACE